MKAKAVTFIRDEKIAGLSTVFKQLEFGKYLAPVLPSEWGILRNIELQVLKHHPGKRCTIAVLLQTSSGKHELIAKGYAKDRSDVYRAMKQISQSGFGPEAEFSIPRPLAFIPDLRLLLQEKVQGPLAREICLNGNERERARAGEQCARWLTHFQTHAPLLGPVRILTYERMEKWVRRLIDSHESLADKAWLLLKELEVTATELDRTEMCACHSGYSDHQIILTETRMVTFDWDEYCIADPMWDVARLIISLQKVALDKFNSFNALDTVVEAFYKTYTAASRFAVARHLPFYKAAFCLRHSRHGLEPILDEGLRILAEET